jgi:prephenate dehydrogenase
VAPAATPPAARAASGRRRRVAIIGLGQIGGSIGLALGARADEWERAGFDADPGTLAVALSVGAIDRADTSLAGVCARAHLAVVAVPVDALARTVDAVAAALPRGAALLDTGSARDGVTQALERAAARGLAAVGGHPLAGSEGRGLVAARADLLRGARFVLLPVRGAPSPAVPAVVDRLLESLGAEPLLAEPAAHDAALARTSHLPYLVARAIAAVGAEPHRVGLSGPGFRDMTRLAGSDPRMAEAYCRANAGEVAAAWRELRAEIDRHVGSLNVNGTSRPPKP